MIIWFYYLDPSQENNNHNYCTVINDGITRKTFIIIPNLVYKLINYITQYINTGKVHIILNNLLLCDIKVYSILCFCINTVTSKNNLNIYFGECQLPLQQPSPITTNATDTANIEYILNLSIQPPTDLTSIIKDGMLKAGSQNCGQTKMNRCLRDISSNNTNIPRLRLIEIIELWDSINRFFTISIYKSKTEARIQIISNYNNLMLFSRKILVQNYIVADDVIDSIPRLTRFFNGEIKMYELDNRSISIAIIKELLKHIYMESISASRFSKSIKDILSLYHSFIEKVTEPYIEEELGRLGLELEPEEYQLQTNVLTIMLRQDEEGGEVLVSINYGGHNEFFPITDYTKNIFSINVMIINSIKTDIKLDIAVIEYKITYIFLCIILDLAYDKDKINLSILSPDEINIIVAGKLIYKNITPELLGELTRYTYSNGILLTDENHIFIELVTEWESIFKIYPIVDFISFININGNRIDSTSIITSLEHHNKVIQLTRKWLNNKTIYSWESQFIKDNIIGDEIPITEVNMPTIILSLIKRDISTIKTIRIKMEPYKSIHANISKYINKVTEL